MAKRKYTPDKNGIYSTLVWDGTYTPDGRKHRKQLRSKKSSADLERQVRQFQAQVEARKITQATDMTFCEYARIWADTYKAGRELNTRKMYDNIINVHFSRIAGIRLDSVARIHLQLLINAATPAVGQKIYMAFRQVIRSAVVDKYLPPAVMDDIFSDVERPRPDPEERRPLTEAEKKAVFAADLQPMDKAFLWILYGCGLRREEALALTVFDIDFKRSQLAVKRAVCFDGNNPQGKGTKSQNGVRCVPLPGFLAEYLARYVRTLSGSNLFHTARGEPMTLSAFRRMWERIQRAMSAALGKSFTLTCHNFRHNYCTQLCYQIPTVSIKRIAQLLGDSERMVLDVYNHIILEREDASGAVEKALSV